MDKGRGLNTPQQTIDFEKCFEELTGHPPFYWQRQFFFRLISGEIPGKCDVPTGLGKTSVIVVWLLALAHSLMIRHVPRRIPLRLVYVVDRRVIVDQSTDEALRALSILEKAESLSEGHSHLSSVARALREIAFVKDGHLITLSTLRGQMAENRQWCLDPSRPAVIIGTVDMIGSRILFSGYGGLGRSHLSLQAGLLAQDTLFLIDEAHLSPTFVATIQEIYKAVQRFGSIRPFHVISLSATIPSLKSEDPCDVDQMPLFDEQKELTNPVARERLCARKRIDWLYFDPPEGGTKKSSPKHKDIEPRKAELIVESAMQYEGQSLSIIIFVSTVGLVNEVEERLSARLGTGSEDRILKMTGEMRGFERDKLVESSKFQMFLPHRGRDLSSPTHYLIATSCAEVGVNLDGDHGVFDLTALDSMIQRIGRINRFGKTDSSITVVIDKRALEATASDILMETDKKRNLNRINRHIARIEARLAQAEAARGFDKASAKNRISEIKAELQSAQKAGKELEKAGIKPDERFQHTERMDRTLFYTWRVLKRTADSSGRIDSSPLALRTLSHDLRAWPKLPVRPALDHARLDDWSMTSLRQSEFQRPLVAYWLRGVTADDTAQTVLCWRAELDYANAPEQAAELAGLIPVGPQERAVLATNRAESMIKELAKHSPDKLVVIISSTDDYQALPLQELLERKERLANATVVIPCTAGGLREGNVTERLSGGPIAVKDVVNEDDWQRYVLRRLSSGHYECGRLTGSSQLVKPSVYSTLKDALAACSDESGGICINIRNLQKAFAHIEEETEGSQEHESAQVEVACFVRRNSSQHYLREADDLTSVGMESGRSVAEHEADVERYVREIARKIGLDDELVEALGQAGLAHDHGKDREWWQSAIGNPRTEGAEWRPLAKSMHKGFDHSLNQHYRHELGSLIEAKAHDELKNHPCRELIMHMVAAHHGYARPHFPERAFDGKQPSSVNRIVVQEAMHRFTLLQQRYGWWQLAYLEAILKAADALASRDFNRGTL